LLFLHSHKKSTYMKDIILRIFLLIFCISATAQIKDKNVLFTIDNEPVTVAEFERVYSKNINLVKDEAQKDKKNYLELFVNYKLKVKEAHTQGLHLESDFINEYTKYRNELSQNYLYEQEITEEIIREAYDRLQEQVRASHILILVSQDAIPSDTLVAYNKIKEIRDKAVAGEDFTQLAKTYSEDPSAKDNGGDLGYFSAFQMVYPFENAAYNTPVGQVSTIVRTSYGYHILKVIDRRAMPEEITASHIMIAHRQQSEVENTKKQIDEIYQRLLQGEDFVTLVKQFSQDVASANRDGLIGRFGLGRLNAPAFEEAAFALKNPGDFSEPVLSDFGWHIAYLVERHPHKTYKEYRDELFENIKGSDRARKIELSELDRIKNIYGYQSYPEVVDYFSELVTDSIYLRKWDYDSQHPDMDKIAFSVGTQNYTYRDFAEHIKVAQRRIRTNDKTIKELLIGYHRDFEEKSLKEFFKTALEKENKEYSDLLQEYRDGLLIYALMSKNIWEKVKNDSIGLVNYYNKNKNNYVWETRVQAAIGSTTDPLVAERAKQLLEEGADTEQITQTLNTDERIVISFTENRFELGHPALPPGFKPTLGTSTYQTDSHYVVVRVTEVLPVGPKEFEEIKGKVSSDYQNELEQIWMQELRQKYKVVYNKKALRKL
jgi:peptidyl-prolyl cis-trans isomerase SurA